MREKAEVVWATTWENTANTILAPLLGIDPLPVGIDTKRNIPTVRQIWNTDTALWKFESLNKNYEGEDLVWVDDTLIRYLDLNSPTSNRLFLLTDAEVGITQQEMDEVETWIDAR